MDLELPGTDRDIDSVALTAGGCERLGHRRLGRAEEPQHTVLAARGACEHAFAPARSRARVATAAGALAEGRAGRRRRSFPCRARRPGRCRRARARSRPPGGSPACALPVANSAYVRPSRSAIVREMDPISRSSSSSRTSGRPATRATSSTVRSSCVGPSPPETRQMSASNPSRNARSRSSTRSPTIAMRAESRPRRTASAARNGPFRSSRSPRTSSEPVTTIAARGRRQDVARVILCAVTTNVVPAGRSTRFPFTRTTTLPGSASASWSERPSNDFCCPCSSVPL